MTISRFNVTSGKITDSRSIVECFKLMLLFHPGSDFCHGSILMLLPQDLSPIFKLVMNSEQAG